MAVSDRASRLSPEWRASIFHFTVFAATGVSSAYFGIWLINRGITPDEIGIINAAPVLAMLAINVLVGRLADRASDWKQMIVVLSLVAGAVPVGLWFVSGFWGILLVWTLAMVPANALIPVVDAATLRMTQRRGSSFGTIRGWGTIGYAVTTAVSGPLIAVFGEVAFVPLFVAWSLARAAASLQLPRFRGAAEAEATPAQPRAGQFRQVLRPWFVLPLVGLGLHFSNHLILSGFGALLWHEQGIPETYIGPLIAVMAVSEATMMFLWRRLNIRISARHLIMLAALVATVRWGAMAFEPPLWLLFFLQMLHAVTFALSYLGGIYFIANWTSDDIAAEAQGFSFFLQQALSVVALVVFGWLVGLFGAKAWLFGSALSLAGALLVWLSFGLQRAEARRRDGTA